MVRSQLDKERGASKLIPEKTIVVAGVDISLRNIGLVKFKYGVNSRVLTPIDTRLTTTEPESKKAKVRKNCDDLNRARDLFMALNEFTYGCDIVFMELPVGSQNARAMASYGVCCGIAASIDNLISVLPLEVKLAAGNKNASKRDMINWAVNKFPGVEWRYKTQKGVTTLIDANEHIADACGAAVAGISTPDFKNALSLTTRIK
jgi:hypothetical protein